MKQKKTLPRGKRQHPQEEMLYSLNFLDNMKKSSHKCFVTHEDFLKLQKKYIKLFKRYQKLRFKYE